MSRASERVCRTILERAGVEVGGTARDAIRVHDARLWDRVVAQRQLGLGAGALAQLGLRAQPQALTCAQALHGKLRALAYDSDRHARSTRARRGRCGP